jgi:hypothetical protein
MLDSLVQSYKYNSDFIYEVFIHGISIFNSKKFDEIKEYTINCSDNAKDVLIKRISIILKNLVAAFKYGLLNKYEKSTSEDKQQSRVVNDKVRLTLKLKDEKNKLLKQYYDVNLLLVYCLNSASEEVRSQIEDELLLPITEIEERRRRRG